MHPLHRKRLLIAVTATFYLLAAYLIAPALWKRHERNAGPGDQALVTTTAQNIPADPLNVSLIGSRVDLVGAMLAAGWNPADAITVRTSVKIGASVALRRPYPSAPVSTLYYANRHQDLAFEREIGRSADQRHHVRFWHVPDSTGQGRDVWLGSASFDRGVGLSHDTGQITHHIDPNLDAERDYLMTTLRDAAKLARSYEIPGVGPTANGRNGGGDHYVTDGQIVVGVLKADLAKAPSKPAAN